MGWIQRQYEKHGLTAQSTLEDIKSKAAPLLEDMLTAQEGAELILQQRIDSRDIDLARIYYGPMSAEDKIILLLMCKKS